MKTSLEIKNGIVEVINTSEESSVLEDDQFYKWLAHVLIEDRMGEIKNENEK